MYIILAIIFPFLVLLYLKMTHRGQFLNILCSIISGSTSNSIEEKNENSSTPETWKFINFITLLIIWKMLEQNKRKQNQTAPF